jgi:GNAT superfamily N-acetyltransferase
MMRPCLRFACLAVVSLVPALASAQVVMAPGGGQPVVRVYEGAAFDVILVGGLPAGGLYVAREDDEIRIVEIALLPEYCNRGIGTTLLHGLQSEAAAAGKPLRIHVERFNPACGSTSGSGFGRSTTGGFICSWNGRLDLPPKGGSHPSLSSKE